MPPANDDRKILLDCSSCRRPYEWQLPPRKATEGRPPDCSNCHAQNAMSCVDCGCDLRIDRYYIRTLRKQTEQAGRRVCGLFCPECTSRYDRMTVPVDKKVPCAQCGRSVPAGQIRVRSVNDTEVTGAVASSQTQFLGICQRCAQEADRAGSNILWTFFGVSFLFVLFLLVCWLTG